MALSPDFPALSMERHSCKAAQEKKAHKGQRRSTVFGKKRQVEANTWGENRDKGEEKSTSGDRDSSRV